LHALRSKISLARTNPLSPPRSLAEYDEFLEAMREKRAAIDLDLTLEDMERAIWTTVYCDEGEHHPVLQEGGDSPKEKKRRKK
jgi:hypothetical protein